MPLKFSITALLYSLSKSVITYPTLESVDKY